MKFFLLTGLVMLLWSCSSTPKQPVLPTEPPLPEPSLPSLPRDYTTLQVQRLISVYDGDTFKADLDCAMPLVCDNISIRFAGVDTPEIRGKCAAEKALAQKAKQFTKNSLTQAQTITLLNVRRGKYFRIVAEVQVDGVDLPQQLIKNGLGYPYEGGKRRSFCY